MQTTKIFFMAALALMTVACSNDDNDIQTPAEQPAKAGGIPFTATISMGESASTRALKENGTTIEATWATGEKVALIYTVGSTPTKTDAEVTKQADGTATISATLASGATNGSAVTIIYPATAADGTTGNVLANLLAAQDGTLATIASKYDVRKGTGKLSINAGGATVNNGTAGTPVSLTNQNAIFKFTLSSGQSIDATHPLVIKKGENDVVTTVTPASSMTSVYVAMPPAASSTYRFIVNSDDNKYIKSGTATITAGNYYQTTLDLSTARYPLGLSSATVDDIGSVIGADRNIYLKNAATPSGNAAVAMIAYVGNGSDCTNGLAIQLNASPASMSWSDACNYSSYPSITGNPGTWRLPSKADWQNMFVGCAKSGDAISPDGNGVMDPIAGFKEKIGATGITWRSNFYWSSTGSGSDAWGVGVDLYGGDAYAGFFELDTSDPYYVLGCLAF